MREPQPQKLEDIINKELKDVDFQYEADVFNACEKAAKIYAAEQQLILLRKIVTDAQANKDNHVNLSLAVVNGMTLEIERIGQELRKIRGY